MIQTIHLTFKGDFSDCEVHGVQTDGNLGQLRAVLRGYRHRENDTALLRATKPDGTVCYLSGIPDGENAFCFPMTEQLTAVAGDVQCDIVLCRDGGSLSSDEFLIKVRPPAATGEMTESKSEYSGLPQLILNTVDATAITEEEIDLIWEELL